MSIGKGYYNALKPYFITVLACLSTIMLCFVTMFCINLTKLNKKTKTIINTILIVIIISLSIASIVVSRVSIREICYNYHGNAYNYFAYSYYESAFAQTLTTAVPAIITGISMIVYIFRNKFFKNLESEKVNILINETQHDVEYVLLNTNSNVNENKKEN